MSIGIRSRAMAGVLVIISLTGGWGHAGSSVHRVGKGLTGMGSDAANQPQVTGAGVDGVGGRCCKSDTSCDPTDLYPGLGWGGELPLARGR